MSNDSNDTGRNSPNRGGCWICETGNGPVDGGMVFDFDYDTWVHAECLEDHDCENIHEYETRDIEPETDQE